VIRWLGNDERGKDMEELKEPLTLDEIRHAVAQGWGQPETKKTLMDPVLAEAISCRVMMLLQDKGLVRLERVEL